MQDYVKGTFRQSIFRNDKGFIIGLLKVHETNIIDMQEYINKTITFTGYFAELNENEKYIMYGEVVHHPKYGFQYNVSSSERVKPDDKDGIVEFLTLVVLVVGVIEDEVTVVVLEVEETIGLLVGVLAGFTFVSSINLPLSYW